MLKALVIKKNKIKIFTLIIIYRVILDLSYYLIISPFWAYSKFVFQPNSFKLIESYLLLFIVFVLIPKKTKKPSHIILWMLFLISYIPMLTLFCLMDESRIFMYASTFFWIIISLIIQAIPLKLNIKKIKQSKAIIWTIFIIISTLSFIFIYKYLGFQINFNIRNVYEIRSSYANLHVLLANYTLNWFAKIIGPLFFTIFLIKKKWGLLILTTLLQILLFSGTGNKLYLFILPFILVLIWALNKKNFYSRITISLIGLILLSVLIYYTTNDLLPPSFAIRRSLLVPAQLSFFYYDFFSENPYTYLSQHHFFQNFINYPYELSPSKLIAKNYLSNPAGNPNNGIISDGYINFGFLGMLLWAIILSFILKLIDNISYKKNIKVVMAVLATFILSIRGTALLTAFITHGLLLALLLLYLLPKENLNRKYE
ncbi:hypothetical protein ISS06_02025 [Patescibacteria group bacterium]|nr:hypothetical protein [Patescibacteria group bacterium]